MAHYLRITKQVASTEVLAMVNEWQPQSQINGDLRWWSTVLPTQLMAIRKGHRNATHLIWISDK